MTKPGKTGLARIIDAVGYSIKGLRAAWKYEAAFRQEIILIVIGIPLAWWLAENKLEFLWLILPLFLIVIAELINSALEAVVDRISEAHHELSGRAKDIGSSLVFVSFIFMGIVWSTIVFL